MNNQITLDEIELHSVSLEKHVHKWLFQDENGDMPSKEHTDQIFALNRDAAKFISEYEVKMGLWKFYPNVENYFKNVIEYDQMVSDTSQLKKWLYKLGIPFRTKVFISYSPDSAFILTWKMVLKYCSKLFFAHDVVVWDKTLNWALYFHHDDIFHFGINRTYSAEVEGVQVMNNALAIAEWQRKLELHKGKDAKR